MALCQRLLLSPRYSRIVSSASLWHTARRCCSSRSWTEEEDAGLTRICGETIKALPAWVATTSVSQLLDRAVRRSLRRSPRQKEDNEAVFEGRGVNEMLVRVRDLGLENREADRR
ncbi:hypothetical protein FOZ62_019645, partial [Perkinsus olseni]